MTPNQKPPPPPPLQSTATTSTGECGNCGTQARVFLHHVRLRGVQRRLCTSCVLRLHPSSFCPVCFAFYDSNPPHPSKRLSCSKCSSFTHSQCATPSPSSSPFLCPPCSDPNFSFALFNKNQNDAAGSRTIDSKLAARLLCAARIASASMVKAVLVARIEAEKKAKDAALAKKRAREALEQVAYLIAKNKDRNNNAADGSVQLSGSASIFNVNKKQSSISHELVKNVQTENNR